MDLRTIELKISRSENLPVLPEMVRAVLKTADNAGSNPRDVEALILRDPALTAKIIRVANSSFYGVDNVSTIGRALAVLGMAKTRSLLVSLVLQQLVMSRSQSRKFSQRDLWTHSLAVGTACKYISRYRAPFLADHMYCAGMMHDIGVLVLDKFCPLELDEVIGNCNSSERSMVESERSVFSFGHADIGRVLAKQWGMDESTTAAIGHHHDPSGAGPHVLEATIVFVANSLAHQYGFTNQTPKCKSYTVTPEQMGTVGIPPDEVDLVRENICAELERAQQSFSQAA